MEVINISSTEFISPLMQEEFRSLYSNLIFTGEENRVICVTSSYPYAGKSYVSYNLARIIAGENKKALLINADMRNSTMAERLGYNPKLIGLSHVLSEQNPLASGIYATDIERFFFIPAGIFPSNPTALLRKDLFRQMLEALRKSFDYIIIDTPPVGMVTDGTIIASVCDGSILVVPSAEESRKTIRESIELLENANENFMGVILNKMDPKKHAIYGKYGKYGKYGRYGYGEYGYGAYGKSSKSKKEKK